MTARELEAMLLSRCAVAARDRSSIACDQREANVFELAARVVRSRFPQESASLLHASDRYFASRPLDRLASVEVVRNGWISSLPRLRDMLSNALNGR
jgi:uncharacterized protein YmfQ (DUF2313 family)